MNTLWDFIKSIYVNKLDTPEHIVDYIAVVGILTLCAEGYSNRFIANALRLDARYIHDVIIEFLNTHGWEEDLDLNPYTIYNSCTGTYGCFAETIKIISPNISNQLILQSFDVCKRYDKIIKELEEYYAKN